MRLLLIHNYYQNAGGEDAVFHSEKQLLETAGHKVITYERFNDEIKNYSILEKSKLLKTTIWSDAVNDIHALIKTHKPHIAHFTNTFPLISPAAYHVCQQLGVPVVQTVQNYRLMCPSASFLRNGKICEQCMNKLIAWPGIRYACYQNSRTKTAVVAAMLTIHRQMKTWQNKVNMYVVATEFSRQKLIQGGLPAERIVVKPNFLFADPGERSEPGEYALFIGRLSVEKGVTTLIKAWQHLPQIPLKIAGNGPLLSQVKSAIESNNLTNIELLGHVEKAQIFNLLKNARFLVFPSEWYEGLPVTLIEASACGLPVVASNLGAMAEIIKDQFNGLHFIAGDVSDLAEKVQWAWAHPDETKLMGHAARLQYERKYSAKYNYEQLLSIYEHVVSENSK